jgi:dTDP-4-amino-4,6-dideoxygalactose transaminase
MSGGQNQWLLPQEPFLSWEFCSAIPQRFSKDRLSVQAGRFFLARNAIYHALGALKISAKARVLVPAYICRAAVEPFLAYGAVVDFYEINRNCEPDFAEIESKIGPGTEAVLALHYFGFPQEIGKFRELCDRHQLALIEDCAHVLPWPSQETTLGTFGDAVVFSWRKFLPIYDGSYLCLRSSPQSPQIQWGNEAPKFTWRVARTLAGRALDNSTHPLARAAAKTVESAMQLGRNLRPHSLTEQTASLDANDPSFDLGMVNQPMSRISHWIFRHSDIQAIVQRRRENYLYLASLLRSIDGITPLHENLPPDVCPWIFPVFCDQLPNAHFLLRRLGIPAAAWDFVKPPLSDLQSFPSAAFLYENLVFLPIHQNLTRQSLDRIAAAVQKMRHEQPIAPSGVCAIA